MVDRGGANGSMRFMRSWQSWRHKELDGGEARAANCADEGRSLVAELKEEGEMVTGVA